MQTLLQRLHPRSPVRTGLSGEDGWLGELLLAADEPGALARVVESRARRMRGCIDARLHACPPPPVAAHPAQPADSPDGKPPSLTEIALGEGRWCLQLHTADASACWPDDAEAAWIDLLDLRLRELAAMQRLRGAADSARRNERLQRVLFAISDLAHADLDLAEMLGRVHRIVCDLTYAENFYIALYDEARDTLRFAYDADIAPAPISRIAGDVAARDFPGSLTFAVLHLKRPLMGPSAELRRQLGLTGDSSLGADCIDWLGVPMLEGERVRGAVVVQSYDPARRYSDEDLALMGYVAQHILTSLQRRRAQEELEAQVACRTAELADANRELRAEVQERERAQRLQSALFRIAELAGARGGLDEFFAGVHGVVTGLLDARNFFIALLSGDGNTLEFPYFVDEWDTPVPARRLANGITEWVLRHRQPLLADVARMHALIDSGELAMFGTLPQWWLGVPLPLGERAVGVMAVQSYDPERGYGVAEQEILQFASFHVATALERKQTQERLRVAHAELERRVQDRTRELELANVDLREQIMVREQVESQLKHEALHDALTGLPNRSALLQRLEHALARYQAVPERAFAVLFLDLDRFKVVNDSVGHLLGDELLIEAAHRIAGCVRAPDSVARLGGDEFTLLLENIRSIDDACHVAARVLAALRDPVRLGDKDIYTSASIGIALSHPRYRRAEELLRDADVAMYRAKAHGRQRYELFDEALHAQALHTLDLESDLRRALARREFEPFLQPIVRLADGAVLGYEALLRWRHGTRGLLTPSEFLAVAEESGNVEQIDWQLYERVLQAIPSLTDTAAYVGINVSARHFRTPELADSLLRMMERAGVAPARLRIEVTEGALLRDPEQARETMLRLRDAGVLTSLDDFGTGYSSLSYLHRFPLHALKIDRSFVSDLRPDLGGSHAAVVRAIRALAGSLGLEVIAEGIETAPQRDALLRLDCMIGQGFLFAPPQPIAQLMQAPAQNP